MNKRDVYWQARAMADEKRANALAGKAAEEISGMYRAQYKKIVRQLSLLSAQVSRGDALTRTQLWNYTRWKELEKMLAEFVPEATRFNTDKIHATLEEVFKNTIGSGTEEFVNGRPQMQTAAVNIIGTDWSGATFSERIWHNQAAIADSIKNGIEDMLIQGRGLPDIKKELIRNFNVAFQDADRLVRTEAAYVLNRAAVERYKNAGVQKVRWSTGPEDGKECERCAARANRVYRIGEEPMIPAHPRCRCIYVGVVELPGENVDVDGPALEAAMDENDGKLPKESFVSPKLEDLTAGGNSGIIDLKAEDDAIRAHIRSDAVNKAINNGNQNKHILTSKAYTTGRSYIYGDILEAQSIVNQYHGTGEIKRSAGTGEWNNREVITADHDIGVVIDPKTGEGTTTDRATIHYGRKGTHIVPTKRKKK